MIDLRRKLWPSASGAKPRRLEAPRGVSVLVALLGTTIGSLLLPLGLSRSLHNSRAAGIALDLWAILLAPGISLMNLVFSPVFIRSHFRLAMTVGFVFNVLTWTGVIHGARLLVARLRNRQRDVPANPA